jgi:hypothetical protein
MSLGTEDWVLATCYLSLAATTIEGKDGGITTMRTIVWQGTESQDDE